MYGSLDSYTHDQYLLEEKMGQAVGYPDWITVIAVAQHWSAPKKGPDSRDLRKTEYS